jgi:hypothetical protein
MCGSSIAAMIRRLSGNAMPDTISEAYRLQQQALHNNPDYGVASLQFAPLVKES